jgi:proteic killer suppression protein
MGKQIPQRCFERLGFRLHRLTGDYAGYWNMVISRNWRIVFQFDGVNTVDVDFVDYH